MTEPSLPAPGTTLDVGDLAPEFTLPTGDGASVSLGDLRGSWAVVYFYPADDTPGCTKEACSFRDSFEDFTDAGATVVGISSDSIESHKAFAAKHRLPFRLLSDSDGAVREAWGVGKSLGMLPGRVTFVLDPQGVVRRRFSSQLRFNKHKDEALAAIRAGS